MNPKIVYVARHSDSTVFYSGVVNDFFKLFVKIYKRSLLKKCNHVIRSKVKRSIQQCHWLALRPGESSCISVAVNRLLKNTGLYFSMVTFTFKFANHSFLISKLLLINQVTSTPQLFCNEALLLGSAQN